MESVSDQAVAVWSLLANWMTSEPVLFWGAWATLLIVFAAAARFAWHLVQSVRAFNSIDILETIPGRAPVRPATIERRIARARKFANSTLRSLSVQVALLVLAGMVVPGIALAAIAVHQDWLLPGQPALTIADTDAAGAFALTEVAIFIVDQALRGALSDVFEVFGFSLTPLANNPQNTIFSGLVLFYRFVCALAAAALVYVLVSVLRAQPHLWSNITHLEAQLEKARQD